MADDSCQVYTGLVPHIWWPWNVNDGKRQLAADLLAANVSVASCPSLDPSLAAQWGIFYAAATEYANSSAWWFGVGTQADQLQSWQCALYTWQNALSAASCKIVVRANPNPPNSGGADALKWVGVAVASVAGAWAVGKGLELAIEALKLIPRKSGKVEP
jgi:hypothetical protein